MVRVADLRPHPQNPNQHPPEQIELLGKIIEHQGWRRPIRVSNLLGFITAGQGALLVAKAKGRESVPVDFQDYDNEEDEKTTQPEIPLSEVLGEANHFIVLKFDNDVDWLQGLTLFKRKRHLIRGSACLWSHLDTSENRNK